MKPKAKEILIYSVLTVLGLYFLVVGLIAAKAFLAPLSLAILLGMILIPLSNRIEKWGIGRGWSSFFSVLVTMLFFAGLAFAVSVQAANVAKDWPQIEKQLKPKIEKLQDWVYDKTGLEPAEQEKVVQESVRGGGSENSNSSENAEKANSSGEDEQSGAAAGGNIQPGGNPEKDAGTQGNTANSDSSSGSGLLSSLGKYVMGFFGFLGTTLLMFIYIFFILLYRNKLRKSILKFFPERNRDTAQGVLSDCVRMSQNYLLGRLLLIGFLIVIYTIGLAVSGVNNAFLISVLAAFLSLLPYIGNIIGFVLAVAMAAFGGGEIMTFVGVTITFTIAQFIESYILEPYVVGERVDLNPLMTILVVVVSGAVWGVLGMVISIPVFGILKIVFDRIKVLQPLGYALGEEDVAFKDDESFTSRIAKKIKSTFK